MPSLTELESGFPGAPVSPTLHGFAFETNPAAAAAADCCWQSGASADPAH